MNKLFRFTTSFVIAGSIVFSSYWMDMQLMLKDLSKEVLSTINYDTLEADFSEMLVYDAVSEKLDGKTLERYIIDSVKMTENIRYYFKTKDKDKPEYYDSVRDVKEQLITTIDDLCEFLNEQDALHPRVYIESEEEK